MQLDGHGAVLVVIDLDSLGHGLPLQQVDQAIRGGADRHALHAIAVGGSATGADRKYIAADPDLAQVILQFHGFQPSFH